ncbi:Ycf51 family protein [Okeania sp.]|uniref:Ycf51 family protein n=1 Tax=Okeania sp. TaxID=3100323 RepID=UPI002B4B37A7|nr:Ycf51 family protein [Okeania sp.]MEB3340482.1 Ycf51 family protein [Okeania sp.]
MLSTTELLIATKWFGIATIGFLILAIIGFILKWGFRFRLVGVTGFMGVLTAGLFGLSLGLFNRVEIPGSVPYTLVYDNGGTKTVIAVSPTISESELTATMEQAAGDLFSSGRLGGEDKLTIRVRTIIHPEIGVSEPLYLGQVKRSLFQREDENIELKIFPETLAKLENYQTQM